MSDMLHDTCEWVRRDELIGQDDKVKVFINWDAERTQLE